MHATAFKRQITAPSGRGQTNLAKMLKSCWKAPTFMYEHSLFLYKNVIKRKNGGNAGKRAPVIKKYDDLHAER
jgi:hypothetical protein